MSFLTEIQSQCEARDFNANMEMANVTFDDVKKRIKEIAASQNSVGVYSISDPFKETYGNVHPDVKDLVIAMFQKEGFHYKEGTKGDPSEPLDYGQADIIYWDPRDKSAG